MTRNVDPIRAHLMRREVGSHVTDGGLDYLVAEWTRVAAAVEGQQEVWLWEEWVNDLDVREILQDVLDNVPQSHVAIPATEAADARFLRASIPTVDCQWGEENAALRGWTREKNWWYWRKPPTPYEE